MARFVFLLLCLAFSWLGVYYHISLWAIASLVMYYMIGGCCIEETRSGAYKKYSAILERYGINSSGSIGFHFSFRDFLALLAGFSIGQLLFVLCNGGLIGSILGAVPWALGLEMATWPHKRLEEYIEGEKFLGFDWPQWLDESLGLSTPGLMPNSSDEKWKGCALEVIGRLKQYPGCRIVLNGLREDSFGNSFFFEIELSKYEEAEAERSINRFFASFGDGQIKCSFYTSEGECIETLKYSTNTPPE